MSMFKNWHASYCTDIKVYQSSHLGLGREKQISAFPKMANEVFEGKNVCMFGLQLKFSFQFFYPTKNTNHLVKIIPASPKAP